MLEFSLLSLILFTGLSDADDFSDVTFRLLPNSFNETGVIAAFGDFNADKLVDIFLIDISGRSLYILNATIKSNQQFDVPYCLYNMSSADHRKISGVMLADFDGDVEMDLLIIFHRNSETNPSGFELEVVWGNHSVPSFHFNNSVFSDEPVLFDANTDMLPDLLLETQETRDIVIYIAQSNGSFKLELISNTLAPFQLRFPGSSAFVDLSSNASSYSPDLFLSTADGFQVYDHAQINDDHLRVNYTFKTADLHQPTGAFSFADFNQDGVIDTIVPICTNDHCEIRAFDFSKKMTEPVEFTMLRTSKDKTAEWIFLNVTHRHFIFPATLHVGDYDMDGFPDLVTIITNPESFVHKAYLLHNVPCSSSPELNCAEFNRQFELSSAPLYHANNTLAATFYDIGEDGTLDIVMSVIESETPKLVFLKNNVAGDTCFLKVTVISGICSASGDCHRQRYGVNVAGPTVKYNTTTAKGSSQISAAGQLSQSTHFALQLPYVVFGLGQTPNFVDSISVGIPCTAPCSRSRVWQQIIPNSQLIVIAKPPDEPKLWTMKLFVTPSQQIVITIVALTATCVLVAAIVLALHLHEKREDNKEKKQESQKFHFDAM